MFKIYMLAVLAIILGLYVFIGIPVLTQIVSTQGILIGYPLEIIAVLILIYLFAAELLKSRKLFVIFMLAFLFQDIVTPPIMIPFAGPTALAPAQQVAGDVFLYTIFTQQMLLPHMAAWLLTYFIIPLILLAAIAYELGTSRLSKLVPVVLG